MPILFEGGAGADVTTWDCTFLNSIAAITQATLILYDRAGFGKSELDTSNHDLEKHGILQGIQDWKQVALMRKMPFPANIPVMDLVAGIVAPFPDSAGGVRWRQLTPCDRCYCKSIYGRTGQKKRQ